MINQASISQTPLSLSSIWHHFQGHLFLWIQEELPALTRKQQQLIETLEIAQLETHLTYQDRGTGRPQKSREAIARAFMAKAIKHPPSKKVDVFFQNKIYFYHRV